MSTKKTSARKDTRTETDLDDLAYVVAYFDNNMNQTRAYMSLHPDAGYDSARTLSARVFAKVGIREEIKRRLDEKAMSAEEAIARLGDIARADLYPFIRRDTDGFIYFNFADQDAMSYLHLIKKIKTKRERRLDGRGDNAETWEGEWVEVELHDAHAAIRDVLKMHGRFTEKIDLTNSDGSLKPAVSDEERLERMKAMAAAIAEEMKKHA